MRYMAVRRTTRLGIVALVAIGLCAAPRAQEAAAGVPERKEILTPVHFIDGKYKSMQGPFTSQRVYLFDAPEREILWITGYDTTIVGQDGETPMSPDFLCHSNLDSDPAFRNEALGLPIRNFSKRVFTNSQGHQQVRFPPGFGVPMASDEALLVSTQVVNQNVEDASLKVRQKIGIDFVRDRDVRDPMKPLFQAQAAVMVSLEGHEAYVGTKSPTAAQHEASCLAGEAAGGMAKHKGLVKDSLGQKFTSHWVITPGRSTYRTLVTEPLGLEFDTTVHFISVHVHAFSESLEFRDLTEDKTLFRSEMKNFDGKIGLEHVDFFSSAEGIPVYEDHDYELVSVYNNTSGEDQDSMAVMFLYLLDKQFRKDAVKASRGSGAASPGR